MFVNNNQALSLNVLFVTARQISPETAALKQQFSLFQLFFSVLKCKSIYFKFYSGFLWCLEICSEFFQVPNLNISFVTVRQSSQNVASETAALHQRFSLFQEFFWVLKCKSIYFKFYSGFLWCLEICSEFFQVPRLNILFVTVRQSSENVASYTYDFQCSVLRIESVP